MDKTLLGKDMEKKQAWTARGAVTKADRAVIRGIAENHPTASRIFMTGEAHGSYLGQLGVTLLANVNDMLDEILFVQTKEGTIRMARFEPEAVWASFHPDLLQQIQLDEEERLGMEVQLDELDFYQSLVATVKEKHGEFIFPAVENYGGMDVFYNILYLGALILYGKPGYMAVPVSQHFALPENAEVIRNVRFRSMTRTEQAEAREIRKKYSTVQGLANAELNFLVSLYEADEKSAGK